VGHLTDYGPVSHNSDGPNSHNSDGHAKTSEYFFTHSHYVSAFIDAKIHASFQQCHEDPTLVRNVDNTGVFSGKRQVISDATQTCTMPFVLPCLFVRKGLKMHLAYCRFFTLEPGTMLLSRVSSELPWYQPLIIKTQWWSL
jgi:hypothetical protein